MRREPVLVDDDHRGGRKEMVNCRTMFFNR